MKHHFEKRLILKNLSYQQATFDEDYSYLENTDNDLTYAYCGKYNAQPFIPGKHTFYALPGIELALAHNDRDSNLKDYRVRFTITPSSEIIDAQGHRFSVDELLKVLDYAEFKAIQCVRTGIEEVPVSTAYVTRISTTRLYFYCTHCGFACVYDQDSAERVVWQ